jgi:RNA polymerase sigma-70 factor, ECF subfamily
MFGCEAFMTWMQAARTAVSEETPTRVSPESDFESFFRTEQARLYRALFLLTGRQHEAEEILQRAFCKVWERWDRVSGMEDPQGYLYRTALNEVRSAYRRARRAARAAVSSRPDDALARSEAAMEVLDALRSLTPRQRSALVLTEVIGYSSAEAARFLDVEPGAVRTLVARARRSLERRREAGDA